jgi:hypothetical protein
MNLSRQGDFYENPLIHFFKTRKIVFLASILVCIGVVILKDYLLFIKLYIFSDIDIASDSYHQAYPYFANIADYIRSEGIPAWSFYHGMGQNILSGKIINPFNLILYVLGKEYLPYGIAYVEFLKIVLAGIIFYYYLKTLSLSFYTCIVGSLLMAFSGYLILGSAWYGHSSFVVSGIFLLFSFEKLFKEDKWFFFPFSIAFIASCSPFYVYILSMFLLIYSIFRIINEGKYNAKDICIMYLKLTGAGILGLAMVAPFMINDLLRIMDSPRIGGAAGYSGKLMSVPILSIGDYLHNITAVLRLFSNDIFGVGIEYKGWFNYLEAPSFYCGLITLLLLPQLFSLLDKRRKILFFLFLLFWTLFIVFPFLRYALYLFTGNYYKGGVSFIIPVILLFFSLHALDFIDKTHRVNRILLLLTLCVLLGILYIPWFPAEKKIIVKEIRLMITSFLVIYTIMIYYYGKGNTRVLRSILLAVICIEACMFSFLTVNKRQAITAEMFGQPVGYNDYTVDVLKNIRLKDKGFFRVEKDYYSGSPSNHISNDAEIQKYYGTPSYNQFNQKYYVRFLSETGIIDRDNEFATRWTPGLLSRPLLQTLASIKYYLTNNQLTNFLKLSYTILYTCGDVTALQNKYFLPLGFTYSKSIPFSDYKNLNILQKDMVMLKAFVVEDGEEEIQDFEIFDIKNLSDAYNIMEYEEDVNHLRQETMILNYHSQNLIKGTIRVTDKKLLFFSIPYDKGWRVTIDDKEVIPKLINIGFMGVIVPEGIHKVELSFESPFLVSGSLIMMLSIIVYVLLILKNKWKRARIINQ